MTNEMEEIDALEAEQSEDALEMRMKKLESKASRLLKPSRNNGDRYNYHSNYHS